MQVQNVIDTDGEWFINKASFGFVDPTNGNRFEPQTPTKAKATEWVKAQEAVIKPWVDPAEADKAKTEAEAAAKAAAEAKAKADAEAAAKAAPKK